MNDLNSLYQKRDKLLEKLERYDDLGVPHYIVDVQIEKVNGEIKQREKQCRKL